MHGITNNIGYDLRNNPRLIQFSDGSQTEYVYSALGEKMKTIHCTAVPDYMELDGDKGELANDPSTSSTPASLLMHAPENSSELVDTFERGDMSLLTSLSIDSTEYFGNFIFENGHAEKYLFPGGYYSYAEGHPSRTGEDGGGYYYYLTDHLGNNRVVVNDNGDIEQTTHYYPFGAVYADAGKNSDFQKFKYTGKELDLTNGLNTYDHGARQNYSTLGVRDRIDPMAEKYYDLSPYVVCSGNPIMLLDPTGLYSFDSTICDNKYYQVIAVFPSNLNDANGAITNDYCAAIEAGVPLIRVDNIKDLQNALKELSKRGVDAATYTINSHGTGGNYSTLASFCVGNEVVTQKSDFSSLKEGLNNHTVFIGACSVGSVFGNGQGFVRKMSLQTHSTVIVSDHPLSSGYEYDESYYLNNNISLFDDGFVMSKEGNGLQKIYNLTIDKDKGVNWNTGWPFLPFSNYFNYK